MSKILIIDDDHNIRESLQDIVSLLGYEADTFSSIKSCLSETRFQDYQLIMSDIGLPGEDVFSFIKHVKGFHPDMPILLVSAFNKSAVKSEIEKSQVTDYISKPFDVKDLSQKIHDALKTKKNTDR